jgi:hypothetical protein
VNELVRFIAASAAKPVAALAMNFLKAPGERISRIIMPQASAAAVKIKYVRIIFLRAAGWRPMSLLFAGIRPLSGQCQLFYACRCADNIIFKKKLALT